MRWRGAGGHCQAGHALMTARPDDKDEGGRPAGLGDEMAAALFQQQKLGQHHQLIRIATSAHAAAGAGGSHWPLDWLSRRHCTK